MSDFISEDKQADDVTGDLIRIIKTSRKGLCVDEDKILEKLVIYIVNRDHKILEHGRKLGKEAK